MSDPTPKKDAAPSEEPSAATGGRFSGLARILPSVLRLRRWAGKHRMRSAAIGGTILLLIAATMVAWAYLARIALEAGQIPLSVALDALDRGEVEQARSLVSRMLTGGQMPRSEFGGPLFVLGAIKSHDAEIDPSPDKRRIDFLVASRYLKEARAYGFPAGREDVGAYLLGKSLLESNQFDDGIAILDEMLANDHSSDGQMTWAIHRLLANALLWMPQPNLEKSLSHSELALQIADQSPDDQATVLIDRAFCFSRSGRFNDAYQALDAISPQAVRQVFTSLARAQITLDELEAKLQDTAAQDRATVVTAAGPQLDDILRGLEEAVAAADDDVRITRRAGYLKGQGLELKGDSETALEEFTHVRQFHDDSPEGIAASLFEAELQRRRGDYPAALLGYRRVLESINPSTYRGYVVPLARVRAKALEALTDFVQRQRYDDARELLTRFTPLFSRAESLKFRGEMLQRWGESLLGETPEIAGETNKDRTKGLKLLREAGLAYEQLAEQRFTSETYTAYLWAAAENYYRGHSFSRATEMLNKFLDNESDLRNAQALLRLGQSHLALGKIDQSVAALEECIQFHPQDSATYQARIDCAKAYLYKGDDKRAEALLKENIAGSKLKPASSEWKDSLFELGMLQYDRNEFKPAIDTLEVAIERYPDDAKTLLAQYVIGVSYRRWAEEQQEITQAARTNTEREKSEQITTERLDKALENLVVVQRRITLGAQDIHGDPMRGAMLRNCYMLAGTVLFDLGRYNEAINAYSNVSSLYPNDPFVLETFVQIANCWRRLDQMDKARGAIQQAQIAFERLPPDANFDSITALGREEWRLLLAEMARW